MDAPDIAEWFEEGELKQCPHCNDARLLPRTDGGELVCLTCGPLSALAKRDPA